MAVVPHHHIRNAELVYETIEGETVIVNLGTGTYFSLVGAGSIVWTELAAGRSLDQLLTRLNREFDAAPQEIEAAVHDLLEELMRERLIDVQTADANAKPVESVPGTPDEAFPARRKFQAPRLQRFADMQELLLLDPVHDVDATGWPHSGGTSSA